MARVTFEITNPQPGNDYRVYAGVARTSTTDPNPLMEMTQNRVDGLKDDGTAPETPEEQTAAATLPNGVVKDTSDLIVWRKLYVERDSMSAPPAAEINPANPKKLTLDEYQRVKGELQDPFPKLDRDRLVDASLDWLTTAMKQDNPNATPSANIAVEALPDALNKRKTAEWRRHIEHYKPRLEGQTLAQFMANPVKHWDDVDGEVLGNAVRDVPSQDDYWVMQVVTIYRGPLWRPQPQEWLSWVEPVKGAPIYIATEEIARNYERRQEPNKVKPELYTQRIILHETLHRFGMQHVNQALYPQNPGNEGVMDNFRNPQGDMNLFGTDAENSLTDRQVEWLRQTRNPGTEGI